MTNKKVLVIGSGPIVIGQAAEFDYSGTQACLALREVGIRTVLVNSNPATIQTDHETADTVYIEPLTVSSLESIINKERPDALIPTVGGQTALNLTMELEQQGILKKYNVEILGTGISAIVDGEDRGRFRTIMEQISQPVLPSIVVSSFQEGLRFAEEVRYPVIIRSLYTLGGTGSSIAHSDTELEEKIGIGITMSPVNQVLLEKSVVGWGEFEYEMMRDSAGNIIMICNMENIDPMGVHTGESIVVAPSQTLSDQDHQILRTAACKIVERLDIQGGCNVQFAFDYETGDFYVIEVNPRLSRSSALASKATGYPIAKIAAHIALGKTLPEIENTITGKSAFFEPALDYVVIKIPRWADDKFADMNINIEMTMKSTGETMAIATTFEQAFYKAIVGLEFKKTFTDLIKEIPEDKVKEMLMFPSTKRLFAILAAFRCGLDQEAVARMTKIHPWFIRKIYNLFCNYKTIKKSFTVFKQVDTCAGEFTAHTPYYYSSQGVEDEVPPLEGPKVIILGSGPIRIGQGIEFDYMTVHAVKALQKLGIKAIIINNNPETVSTDYTVSDRLYFEPLRSEFVLNVIKKEADGLLGVIPQFGGQTSINLVKDLESAGVHILGTNSSYIFAAEDREVAANYIQKIGHNMPRWVVSKGKKDFLLKTQELGFPLLVRPSFVLGGEGMIIARSLEDVESYAENLEEQFSQPILIDQFLEDAVEIDIDLISDGKRTISFVIEQLDPAGVHSGDSRCVFPAQSLDKNVHEKLNKIASDIATVFGIVGVANIQCAIKNDKIYILEVNPRGSRTIPFLGKCLGISLPAIATQVIMGEELPTIMKDMFGDRVCIKYPVFSLEKLPGVCSRLSPLMKSTGEGMCIGKSFEEALKKVDHDVDCDGLLNIYPLISSHFNIKEKVDSIRQVA